MEAKPQFNYEIDGKKYFLFNVPVTSNEGAQRVQKHAMNYGGITQGARDFRPGWFSGSAILNILIPEEKVLEFSRAKVPK